MQVSFSPLVSRSLQIEPPVAGLGNMEFHPRLEDKAPGVAGVVFCCESQAAEFGIGAAGTALSSSLKYTIS